LRSEPNGIRWRDAARAQPDERCLEQTIVPDHGGTESRGEVVANHRVRRPLQPQVAVRSGEKMDPHHEVLNTPEIQPGSVGAGGHGAGDRLAVARARRLELAAALAQVAVQLGDRCAALREREAAQSRGVLRPDVPG
jgi:hypothetical protein